MSDESRREGRTWAGWAEAFRIFAKYSTGADDISASHDEVFAGPRPETVAGEDYARLLALGWTHDVKHACFRRGT